MQDNISTTLKDQKWQKTSFYIGLSRIQGISTPLKDVKWQNQNPQKTSFYIGLSRIRDPSQVHYLRDAQNIHNEVTPFNR
jgi:hypothetical protein